MAFVYLPCTWIFLHTLAVNYSTVNIKPESHIWYLKFQQFLWNKQQLISNIDYIFDTLNFNLDYVKLKTSLNQLGNKWRLRSYTILGEEKSLRAKQMDKQSFLIHFIHKYKVKNNTTILLYRDYYHEPNTLTYTVVNLRCHVLAMSRKV